MSLIGSGATAAATSLPGQETNDGDTPLEQIRESMESTGHSLDEEGIVEMSTPDSDEPVRKTMTGHEILGLLEETSLGGDKVFFEDAPEALQVPLGSGPENAAAVHEGAGNEDLKEDFNPDWPFCDYASVFVIYLGPFKEAVVADETTEEPGPDLEGLCSEVFGPTQYRTATLDTAGISPAIGAAAGCAASVLITHPTETVGNEDGGYACGHATATVDGATAEFHFSFFGISFDYYPGSEAQVQHAG